MKGVFILFKKYLPLQSYEGIFFFHIIFGKFPIVLFTFRSMFNLELVFVYGIS